MRGPTVFVVEGGVHANESKCARTNQSTLVNVLHISTKVLMCYRRALCKHKLGVSMRERTTHV